MKAPMTLETKTSIRQRYDKPSASLLSFANPLHILRVDFTLRELSVITGLSERSLARHSTNYSFNSPTHRHLVMFADDYLRQLTPSRVTHLLIELNNGWGA